MKLIAFWMILLLAGCASNEPRPLLTETRVERVEVPIRVPCLKEEDVPAIPPTTFKKGLDLRAKAAAAEADIIAFEGYAARADAALRSCVRLPSNNPQN